MKKIPFYKFFKFFSLYTLIGIISILIGIIFDLKFSEILIMNIFSKLLETIGIALLLGSIFDFSKNSTEFTEFITSTLSDIIVSKSFLAKLSEKDKKEALSLVLQPSDKQIEQYSNINEYFKKQIDSSMSIFNTNFKSHTVIDVRVCKKDGIVVTQGCISYRIYKIQDKFEPISVKFEREGSKVIKKRILYPEGSIVIGTDENEVSNETVGGKVYSKYLYKIPEDLNKYSYLTIESDIYEPGYDHWTNFHWTSLTPYDGLSFTINCEEGLAIKEYVVFDEKTPYDICISEDNRKLRILSNDWLNAHTGISITIGAYEIENGEQ